MNYHEIIYSKHVDNFAKELVNEDRICISNSWFDETTADYWRHARSYEFLDCLFHLSDTSWLTVGDGRWGLDSIRIRNKGFGNVLPTDISEHLLKESKKRGYINDYAVENAEKLTFGNDSFDYVFCKESFHHFPRPYLALYEMYRVARLGVFIVEPNDAMAVSQIIPSIKSTIRTLLSLIKHKLKGTPLPNFKSSIAFNAPGWEVVGNYVYSLSRREAEKIALGLNMPQLVIKGLNDHYIKGCEFEPADMEKSTVFREIVSRVEAADKACLNGNADYNMLMVGFLKTPMDAQANALFRDKGWTIIDLPRNPYI